MNAPIISVKTENAMSADAFLKALDQGARLGATWLRESVATLVGAEPTKDWARGIARAELEAPLAIVMNNLCRAAVTREGIAHAAGFDSLRTHMRNAFPCVKGVSARLRESEKPLTIGKGYMDGTKAEAQRLGSVDSHGAAHVWRAQLLVRWGADKADVSDPTRDVASTPGDAPTHNMDMSDTPETSGLPEGVEIGGSDGVRYTYAATIAVRSEGFREGFAAGQIAVSEGARLHDKARLTRALAVAHKARMSRDKARAELTALRAELTALKASAIKTRAPKARKASKART